MAKELEQFLGRGNEKAFWIFSYKNAGGAVLLAFLGSRIGQIFGGGFLSFLFGVMGVIIGLLVTWDRKGYMWAMRWIFKSRFLLSKAMTPDKTVIDAQELYEVVEIKEQPITFKKAGQTVIAPMVREQI